MLRPAAAVQERETVEVFLELSKGQDVDGFDADLDPSVKWKLPQEAP